MDGITSYVLLITVLHLLPCEAIMYVGAAVIWLMWSFNISLRCELHFKKKCEWTQSTIVICFFHSIRSQWKLILVLSFLQKEWQAQYLLSSFNILVTVCNWLRTTQQEHDLYKVIRTNLHNYCWFSWPHFSVLFLSFRNLALTCEFSVSLLSLLRSCLCLSIGTRFSLRDRLENQFVM
jgi:hypothetical protein